jgi:hypothetical protein
MTERRAESAAVKAAVFAFRRLGWGIDGEAPARVQVLDTTLAKLLACQITVADIADGMGVGTSTLTHLRKNLGAYSFSQRRAAYRLLVRFLEAADPVLNRAPEQKRETLCRTPCDSRSE